MKKEEKKVNFDLSALSVGELIEVYGDITSFLDMLEDKKIKEEIKEAGENE